MWRYGALGTPEQLVEFSVEVDEVTLAPWGNDPEGPVQEVCDRRRRGLEVRLAEWGRQGDVEHAETMIIAGPHLHVALARRPGQPGREQVPGEDPLHRVVGADMEGHQDRVRVAGVVAEAGHEGDGPVFGDHKTEPELRRDSCAAVHHPARPFPCRVPDCRAS